MTTLQGYLNQKYPTQRDKKFVAKEIILNWISQEAKEKSLGELEGGELDLRKFKGAEGVLLERRFLKTPITKINVSELANLQMLVLSHNILTSIDLSGCVKLDTLALNNNQFSSLDLSGCVNLVKLYVDNNNLTSLDFLKTLPNPEKLEYLRMSSNNIQPVDLELFSRFVNLKALFIGTDYRDYEKDKSSFVVNKNKRNRFYGSLKPLQKLTKLEELCIANTDINEGLEYLSQALSNLIKKGELPNRGYSDWQKDNLGNLLIFDCQAQDPDTKVARIQKQLRPYDYDVEAWQLSHPHNMYQERPELFELPESKSKWLDAIDNKIGQTNDKLTATKVNESDKTKKIKRLELKLQNLKLIKKLILTEETVWKLQEQIKRQEVS